MIPLLRVAVLSAAVLATRVQTTPSEVVKAFYMACNDGLYSKAEKLATPESVQFLKTTMSMAGSFKGYCDDITEEGTLVRVEIVSEKLRGEGAIVDFKFHFKGGKSDDGHEELIRMDSGWRIQLLGQGGR